ncbi:MAG: hypothetical protein ABI563_12255 [Specibacter sp.]
MSKLPPIMDPTLPKLSKPARVMAKNTVTGRVRPDAKGSCGVAFSHGQKH